MKFYLLSFVALVLFSCNSAKNITIPTTKVMPTIDDAYTIIWQGTSEVYKYGGEGKYNRIENYDYTFEVVQRRYGNVWKSTKTMHRIHPDFPGNGKKQNKTMYFEVAFSEVGDSIVAQINSSEGTGKGITDNEFREQKMEIELDIPNMAPYNTMRLVQHYNYEEGMLTETVEIFKLKKDGSEAPFMKIEETAYIFRPLKMESAPTKFE